MFLGLRDILHARGRFALIASAVGLITVLLVMLTGLTNGLGKLNTSALENTAAAVSGADARASTTRPGAANISTANTTPANTSNPETPAGNNTDARFAFGSTTNETPEVSFTGSVVTKDDVATLTNAPGVTAALPLGTMQTRLEAARAASAAVFGLPAGTTIPGTTESIPTRGVVLSESLLEETGTAIGGTLTVAGLDLEVQASVPDDFYSHTPVAWVSTTTWQDLARIPNALGSRPVGTVVVLAGDLDDAAWEQLAADSGTTITTVAGAFQGLGSYASERGSLVAMQGFLYAISALVTVSFLTVWTIQRTRDLAILRALGASAGYLVKDALGQATIVLAVGAGLGALAGWGLGTLVSSAVPFALSAGTVLVPAAGIWLLGLIGAFIATRSISRVDPLAALGGNA